MNVEMAKGHKTGGRAKGVLNKLTRDIKTIALGYTEAANKELGRLSVAAESEATRVMAIKEINDRAFGKAAQAVQVGNMDGQAFKAENVLSIKFVDSEPDDETG